VRPMAGPNAVPPGYEGQDKDVQHSKVANAVEPVTALAEQTPAAEAVPAKTEPIAEPAAASVQTSDVVKHTLELMMKKKGSLV